ncbi:MAG: hypothetical protein WCD04_15905 [Terriglobia bacterium]|jgi:hypothetical protein
MNNAAGTELPSASQTSDILTEVALNLRWSRNHSADQLWERLQAGGLLVRPPEVPTRYGSTQRRFV